MMTRSTKGARSMNSLEQEIRQLRRKARQLEDRIDENYLFPAAFRLYVRPVPVAPKDRR